MKWVCLNMGHATFHRENNAKLVMNHQIRRYPISERSTSLSSCPPVATELNTWGQTLHLKIDIFSGQKYVYLHSLICFICWLGSWITFHGTASDSCTDPGDLRVFGAGSKMLNRYLKSNIKIVFESKLKRLKCQFLLNPSLIRKKPRKPICLLFCAQPFAECYNLTSTKKGIPKPKRNPCSQSFRGTLGVHGVPPKLFAPKNWMMPCPVSELCTHANILPSATAAAMTCLSWSCSQHRAA